MNIKKRDPENEAALLNNRCQFTAESALHFARAIEDTSLRDVGGFVRHTPAVKVQQMVATRLWVLAYEMEDQRSMHAQMRQYLRSAAFCLGLAAVKVLEPLTGSGARHV